MTTGTQTTQVVNIKDLDEHYPEWRVDETFVYIGRANVSRMVKRSKWANPHTLRHKHTAKDRENVVRWYRAHLLNSPELLAALPELRHKTLVCWCKTADEPNKPCHGDVLIELLAELETSG